MRRAEIYDALEAELGVKTIFELAPAVVRGAGGFRGRLARRARRLARHASPVRRGRHHAGGRAALRAEDRHVHRPARDARARRRRWRAARACSTVYAYAGGFALAAARGGATAVTAVDSSARAVARIEAHAAANGVDDRRRRGRRVSLSRDGDAARVRSGRDRSAEVRARAQGSGGRPQGLRAPERAGAAGGRAGRHPGHLLLLAERRRRDLRAHRRRRRQAGRPRGAGLRAPRPRRRPPAAARLHRRAST